ncbi:alpha/beta-hydrolase [Ascodesmis nigricans]|uniref:Alpha/beta-hydrolase n=1 Tax=Ascodesmis nigricans TaxID=341454 RepID=A0A4S2MYT3_9PEZI|nr:alpha/beta-hydrolase [Ascodesmis nigricans]
MQLSLPFLLSLLPLTLSQPLSPRQSCPPLELLFARGTAEIPKLGILGGPFGKALSAAIPGAMTTGIDYPASNFITSPPKGVEWVTSYMTEKGASCPQTKFVIAGYSLGSFVVHQLAEGITPELRQKIVAAGVFGDPTRAPFGEIYGERGYPVQNEGTDVFDVCGTIDTICGTDSNGPTGGHITYGINGAVQDVSAFIAQRLAAYA